MPRKAMLALGVLAAATAVFGVLGELLGWLSLMLLAGLLGAATFFALMFVFTLAMAAFRNVAEGTAGEGLMSAFVGLVYGVWVLLLLFALLAGGRNQDDFEAETTTPELLIVLTIVAAVALAPGLIWSRARLWMAEATKELHAGDGQTSKSADAPSTRSGPQLGLKIAIGMAVAGVAAAATLVLVNVLDDNVEAGMWQPTGALPTEGEGHPQSWQEVRKFAISMESGICVNDGPESDPVLDHVDVEETEKDVTITAFAELDVGGSCDSVGVTIDAGTVTLARPLGDRKLIDGSIDHRFVVGPRSDRAWNSYLQGSARGQDG